MGIEIGPLSVRRSIHVAAPPARVWEEFESFERLAAWFGTGHRLETYEARAGGRVRLSIEGDGQRIAFGGDILVFEPQRELSFANLWESDDAWEVATIITLRLAPLWEGCHVELFHHGFERLGSDAGAEHAGYEEGWDVHHLTALKAIVEGAPAAR